MEPTYDPGAGAGVGGSRSSGGSGGGGGSPMVGETLMRVRGLPPELVEQVMQYLPAGHLQAIKDKDPTVLGLSVNDEVRARRRRRGGVLWRLLEGLLDIRRLCHPPDGGGGGSASCLPTGAVGALSARLRSVLGRVFSRGGGAKTLTGGDFGDAVWECVRRTGLPQLPLQHHEFIERMQRYWSESDDPERLDLGFLRPADLPAAVTWGRDRFGRKVVAFRLRDRQGHTGVWAMFQALPDAQRKRIPAGNVAAGFFGNLQEPFSVARVCGSQLVVGPEGIDSIIALIEGTHPNFLLER